MYHSIEPPQQNYKKRLGKNPLPLRILDEHLIKLDRIAISKTRQVGKTIYRADCIREAITQYIERELGTEQ